MTYATPDFEAINGTTATIHCHASGSPPVTGYMWKKNGVPIVNNPHIREADEDHLVIYPVTPEDIGVYECFPQSPAGTFNSSRTKLDVRGKN